MPSFSEVIEKGDKNGDDRLTREEFFQTDILPAPEEVREEMWRVMDPTGNGHVDADGWDYFVDGLRAENGVVRVRLGGRGDVTESHVVWRHSKSLPNVPSPLLYKGVLYLLKEGGILTALDPETGQILKRGRITGALGAYFASPVAGDGKLYTASRDGKVAILKPGSTWEVLTVTDLGEGISATPALIDGKVIIRTEKALYAFGSNAEE